MLFCLGFEFRGDVQYAEKEWKQRSSREERKGGRGGGCTSATALLQYACNWFPLVSVYLCGNHGGLPGPWCSQVPCTMLIATFFSFKSAPELALLVYHHRRENESTER